MARFTRVLHPQVGETVAINATATATVAQMLAGVITSTSAAATAITTPTVAQLVAYTGAKKGSSFEFMVDNISGANTVTITLGTGLTASSAITGGTTLTVASGAWARFRITFVSTTAAIISRVN